MAVAITMLMKIRISRSILNIALIGSTIAAATGCLSSNPEDIDTEDSPTLEKNGSRLVRFNAQHGWTRNYKCSEYFSCDIMIEPWTQGVIGDLNHNRRVGLITFSVDSKDGSINDAEVGLYNSTHRQTELLGFQLEPDAEFQLTYTPDPEFSTDVEAFVLVENK